MDIQAILASPEPTPTASQKKVWLLTYCPAGRYITPAMLRDHQLAADECHSTADQVMNFTYIHLSKKVRQTRIEKFMRLVRESHGIVQNEIFGYEPIACASPEQPIHQHIVFQMLLKHYRERAPSFQPDTDGEPVLKRGHLFSALETDIMGGLEHRSKKQLVLYARSLEQKLEASKAQETELHRLTATYLQVSRERCNLRVENELLKRKLGQMEGAARP